MGEQPFSDDATQQQNSKRQDPDVSTSRESISETMSVEQKPQQTTEVLCQIKTIGRFEVKKVLGRGGFGVVYLARDTELDRNVALKCPLPERFDSADKMESFVAEARTAAQLKHPGIVSIYDVVRQNDESPFVVMEFIDGPSLKERLSSERLSLHQIAELMDEVASAVSFAHKKGFVHRDLKPANVLLDDSGKPHVADFGLAVHEHDQRQRRGELAGTLAYMSPEQVRGDVHHIDGRSDIWSLGVMVYEMVTGRLPFGGDSFDEISDEILYREPRPPRQMDETIPTQLEAIINRCCAKEIKDRYSTSADLANDLRQLALELKPTAAGETTKTSGGTVARQLRTGLRIGKLGCALSLTFASVLVVCGFVVLPRLFGPAPSNEQVAANSSNEDKAAPGGKLNDPETKKIVKPFRSGDPRHMMSAADTLGGQKQLQDSIDVMVWDEDDESRRRLVLSDIGAIPLKQGDGVKVQATLSKPSFAYIVWIDSAGVAQPIFPWKPGDWDSRPEDESPIEMINLPSAADEFWPMSGDAGMETLLLLVRETPLPKDVDLKKIFADLPPQPSQKPGSAVWFVDGQTVTVDVDTTRAPILFDPMVVDDPVLKTQRLLQDNLAPYFQTTRAVSFANSGK